MQRYFLSLFIPPLAVCRYGCAGCCAAPITVFWIAGIASFIYGFLGGPLGLDTVSWNTIGLGILLWSIAVVWAMITVHNVKQDVCTKKSSIICGEMDSRLDESDPMDSVMDMSDSADKIRKT